MKSLGSSCIAMAFLAASLSTHAIANTLESNWSGVWSGKSDNVATDLWVDSESTSGERFYRDGSCTVAATLTFSNGGRRLKIESSSIDCEFVGGRMGWAGAFGGEYDIRGNNLLSGGQVVGSISETSIHIRGYWEDRSTQPTSENLHFIKTGDRSSVTFSYHLYWNNFAGDSGVLLERSAVLQIKKN